MPRFGKVDIVPVGLRGMQIVALKGTSLCNLYIHRDVAG